jgi:hypothetical protein
MEPSTGRGNAAPPDLGLATDRQDKISGTGLRAALMQSAPSRCQIFGVNQSLTIALAGIATKTDPVSDYPYDNVRGSPDRQSRFGTGDGGPARANTRRLARSPPLPSTRGSRDRGDGLLTVTVLFSPLVQGNVARWTVFQRGPRSRG